MAALKHYKIPLSPHFDLLVSDFILYITAEKGLSQNSIESYRRDVLKFLLALQQEHIEEIRQVTKEHLFYFLSEMKSAHYSRATLSRTFIALKVFFRFLKRENKIDCDWLLCFSHPKVAQLIPAILSHDEIDAILSQPNSDSWTGARDSVILEILYGGGLRVSEAAQLKIHDIDEEGFFRIVGKGSKERIVPLGKKAIAALDHYLLYYRNAFEYKRNSFLFLNRFGKPISRISIWKMVKKYAKRAQITKNIFPHTFRHSFASHLLDRGADLRIIQELLGHSDISSTNRYTHLQQTQIQRDFERFHSRYRKG